MIPADRFDVEIQPGWYAANCRSCTGGYAGNTMEGLTQYVAGHRCPGESLPAVTVGYAASRPLEAP